MVDTQTRRGWEEEATDLLTYLLDMRDAIEEDIGELVSAIDNKDEAAFNLIDKKVMDS